MPNTQLTEQNTLITVSVDNVNLGTFVSKSGGQVEADESKTRLGGMGKEISLPVLSTVENVTVAKHWDSDMRSKYASLKTKVGKKRMSVSVQALDGDGNKTGSAESYAGIFIRITPPDQDVSSNDAAMVELELSSDSL